MATTAQTFQTAYDRLANTDPDMWLGVLVWYGVEDLRMEHSQLVQNLANVGLSGFIPRLPSDVDVFRRVCSVVAKRHRKVRTSDPKVYDNYLIRDLPMDDDGVYKKLVKERVEPGNLKYETELCEITFHRSDGHLSVDCGRKRDVVARQIIADIEDQYEAERGHVNEFTLRETIIRRIVLSADAINVRGKSGGVYFVPKENLATIDKLRAFVALLPQDKVNFHRVPLLNDGEQRLMVLTAYETELVAEIQSIEDELKTLERQGRKITSDRVAQMMVRLKELEARDTQYQDMMQTSSDTARSALSMMRRLILKLASNVAA